MKKFILIAIFYCNSVFAGNAAIIYGLGASASGNGNGLKKLATDLKTAGWNVDIYGVWDKPKAVAYELLAFHSLGFKWAYDYAVANPTVKMQFFGIEPVANYSRWLNIFGSDKGTPIALPSNVTHCASFYTNSWPKSYLIGNNGDNYAMLQYNHTSIVPPAVERIESLLTLPVH